MVPAEFGHRGTAEIYEINLIAKLGADVVGEVDFEVFVAADGVPVMGGDGGEFVVGGFWDGGVEEISVFGDGGHAVLGLGDFFDEDFGVGDEDAAFGFDDFKAEGAADGLEGALEKLVEVADVVAPGFEDLGGDHGRVVRMPLR